MNDWSEENPNLSKVPDKMEEMNALQEKIQAGELVNVDTTSRATFQLVMNLLPNMKETANQVNILKNLFKVLKNEIGHSRK